MPIIYYVPDYVQCALYVYAHTSSKSKPCWIHCFLVTVCLLLFQGDTASNGNNEESKDVDEATKDEVMIFHTNCSHCNSPADTRMKLVDILLKVACSSAVLNCYMYIIAAHYYSELYYGVISIVTLIIN